MSHLKRSLAAIISGSFLVLVGFIVEPQSSARGQQAAPELPATPPNEEIPRAVGAVIDRSQNRFAFTDFVKLALRRRAVATRNIAPNAVGAAPIADVTRNMQPADVEDAVISFARELSGAVPPEDIELAVPRQNAIAQKTIAAAASRAPAVGASGPTINVSPDLPKFDWRDPGHVALQSGIISAAKDQTLGGAINCGDCWAFATIGTFEGADALVNRRLINASEQNLLDCTTQVISASPSVPYNCAGGGWWAFDYIIKQGVAKETSYPYTAVQSGCNDSIDRPYHALTWNYVLSQSEIPIADGQIKQIKAALCQYGPVGAAVYASGPLFSGYGASSPPIRDFDSGNAVVVSGQPKKVDHVVVIVGWDDSKKAWAIKNSWPGWGTQGFGYIGYTANNIGYGAAYVVPAIAATGPMASAAPAAPAVGAAPATRNITPRTSALRTIAPPRFFPAPEPPAVGAPPVPAANPP